MKKFFIAETELNLTDAELLKRAEEAVTHASPQFSHFNVGTAARLNDGSIYTSSNKILQL